MKKKVPHFKSEPEERDFWATADSTRYIDWVRARRRVFPNLHPSLKTISLRLPGLMLEELKLLANKRDVPYQSLLKLFLAKRIEEELRQPNGGEATANSAREGARLDADPRLAVLSAGHCRSPRGSRRRPIP